MMTKVGDLPYAGGLPIMTTTSRITTNPAIRSGKPCVKGTRITVSDVLEYLASGMTTDEIVADFPELKPDDIRACLAFAAEREKRLMFSSDSSTTK
jgi:uncharacterized protein (DUF433 family)